ncbi:hypothetical protein [Acidiphilium acidophilum]|uniref:Uncharacterized protein n=1 Tax=Acidiphilium acidophilum TaxID=76588 RepID=A0AAW9DP58_ACIAO|nr:hypothetical protein [Acidiphilium acidophilum]MDX5930510.1 hypothetical protein [Acidiphilium acidophilum]
MRNRKTDADNLATHIIDNLEAKERRARLTLTLPVTDARRAMRSLASRADGILARRDRDPVLRALAEGEAAHCRRIAAAIEEAIGGAA